jgi:molecular chaperone DnaK
MVGGPTRMPSIQKFVEEATGKKVERGVDPMECVALGASIQAGVLAGEVKDVLLLDVTPLSLGIETLGGVCTKLIERNATIPTKKSQIFSTASDGQNAVTIHVLQGERPMATDNKSLGRFDLMGIPPAPRGVPQIEVSFDIDANGIVHVGAKDLGTGKEQSIKITATQKLNDEEIQRMKKEAEVHAEDDKKRKEEAETINEADTLVYTAEKVFEDMKGKVSDANLEKVKTEVEELKKMLQEEKRDVSKIKSKLDEVNKKIQELSTEMYKKVAEEQAKKQGGETNQETSENSSDTEAKDDTVVDAEFTEKSDESKTAPKKKSKK